MIKIRLPYPSSVFAFWGSYLLSVIIFLIAVIIHVVSNVSIIRLGSIPIAFALLHIIVAYYYVFIGIARKTATAWSALLLLLYYGLLFLLYIIAIIPSIMLALIIAGGEFSGASPYVSLPSALLFVLVPATLWYFIVRRPIYRIMMRANGDIIP